MKDMNEVAVIDNSDKAIYQRQSDDAGLKHQASLSQAITVWWQIKALIEQTPETDHEVMIQFADLFRQYLASYDTAENWIRVRDWADQGVLRAEIEKLWPRTK